MNRIVLTTTLLGAVGLSRGLPAQAPAPAPEGLTEWRIDPAHSAIHFRVRHLGLTWVNGAFRQWTGELLYDPSRPDASRVTVRIQTASIDTENQRRDNDLRQNYLVVDSFPEITFTSTRVERAGPNRLRVTGDLTIRGLTRPVVLDTEVGGILSGERGRRTSFTATTTLTRQDYGITLNRLLEGAQVVGDEVRITIDLEAILPPPPG
jgi:polyisoprenoid-binding protein YceI